MKFTIDKKEKYVTFRLDEEKLDSIMAPDLKSELILLNTEGYRNIILDLGSVNYVDSSGLSAILIGNRMCKDSGGIFVITKATAFVLKLIRISQLDPILALAPTYEEATNYILMVEVEREVNETGE